MTLFAWPDGALTRKRVVQCALSRVCGVCGRPLGRPIAFVGTPEEIAHNILHAPPLHLDCVDALRDAPVADESWEVLTTSGFEFVRPARDDDDPEPRFAPNSLIA